MRSRERADVLPVIFGLGNPGSAYRRTPHNIGADLVRRLAIIHGGSWHKTARVGAHTCTISIHDMSLRLAIPTVFMNESGMSVKKSLAFFRVPTTRLLVIHDDSDLRLGTVKFTNASRSAGHHGIESIMRILNTSAFARIRIGIRPAGSTGQALSFILKSVGITEWDQLIARSLPQIETFVAEWLKEKE